VPEFGRLQGGSGTGVGTGGRDAELEAVKDYVVGLQNTIREQAKICDLLLPTAR
jgi:hypothetical protein